MKKETILLGRTVDRPYWVMMLSIAIRALHQVGAAVFLASFLLPGVAALPWIYLVMAGGTGLALMVTEGMRHRQLLREWGGIVTLVKLMLLGMAYHGWIPVVPAVLAAFFMASLFSHAPKHIRHRLIF